jgi:4-aminobutyrate aminotransferase/(S)-3-amino-2-methylpropionate transaminase
VLRAGLEAIARDDPRVGEVRGRGAMIAIELVDPATKRADAALTRAVATRCVSQGVIALTCGTFGNVIRFLPPLSITNGLLADALGVLRDALRTV